MKKLMAILFIATLATGCGAKKQANGDMYFKVLKQAEYGGHEEPGFVKVNNAPELKALYAELGIGEVPMFDELKYNIVAVFMGQKRNGGYSITIEKAHTTGNTTYLKKKETTPQGMATMAITAPYVIVEIPKTDKVVIE